MTDTAHPDPELLRQLFTTPPSDFVATRNEIVKQLRADGERDVAKVVGALRRPSIIDWALNTAAGEEPDDINVFVDAANEVQDAQSAAIEGRSGGDIRSAMRELREQTAHVVKIVGAITARLDRPGGTSSPGAVTARLAEIAGTPAACALLRVGLVGADEAGVDDPFSLQPAVGDRATSGRAAPRASTKEKQKSTTTRSNKAAGSDSSSARRSTVDDRRRAEARARERRAHVRALADAQRAHTVASKQLADADRVVRRHEAAVSKAQSQVEDAQARLDEATARHREAVDDLDVVQQQRDETATVVDAAQEAVDDAQQVVDADRDAPATAD